MEGGQYFVQIKDQKDIRRGLLGSSKQIIQILQRVERIKKVRARKVEKMSQLKSLHKEILFLAIKLKKKMPEADFRVNVTPNEKKEIRRGPGDELKKLEDELRMIEEKIGMLG